MSSTTTVCELPTSYNENNNDLDLALDAKSFDYHVLSGSKSFRVTRLDVNGSWHETDEDIYTGPYEDQFIKINGSNVSVKTTGVQLLLQSAKHRPKTLLCSHGRASILYIYMKLRKTMLPPGTYTIGSVSEKNYFFLINNTYILMVTLPDEPTTVRSPISIAFTDKGLDPSALYFASKLPVQDHDHTNS